jgi:hypothetical protein
VAEEDTFPTRVEKRLAPFDPEGSGFDENTASRLRKEMPLTLAKPKTKPAGPVPEEFNEGAFEAWVWHPEENDWAVHGGSLDPATGMLLKGMKHPTVQKTIEYEKSQGREFVKRKDGRYYLQDIKK